MKIKVAALILSVIVAGGIVFQSMHQETPEEDNQNQTEIDLPEMKGKYTKVQSPANGSQIESVEVPIRFQVSTEAEMYKLVLDGEERKQGAVNNSNTVTTAVSPGEHSYTIRITDRNGTVIDSTRKRYFTYTPSANITLDFPEGEIQSGQTVEFSYSIQTDNQRTVELIIDGEIAAEDSTETDQVFETTVDDIEQGNHTWKVNSEGISKTKSFQVAESLPAGEITRFSVQYSDDGWNARVDVETHQKSSYELMLNNEVVEKGTVEAGDSSLGIPISPQTGENSAKIIFENSEGEFESNEETFNN